MSAALPPWSARLAARCPPSAAPALESAVADASGLGLRSDDEREAYCAGRLHAVLVPASRAAAEGAFLSTRPERRAALGEAWGERVRPSVLEGVLSRDGQARAFGEDEVLDAWRRWRALRDAGRVPDRLFAYAHVPFCRTRCSFCQCDAIVARGPGEVEEWLEAILAEAARFASGVGALRADAASIGGGTPTFLAPSQLERLLSALCGPVFTLAKDAYFSVEATPDTATPDRLEVLARHGVNRVSIGVQSLHRPTLEVIGRSYQTFEEVGRAVAAVKAAGLVSSLDLVASLPREEEGSFLRNVRDVLDLGPDELVVYPYRPVERAGRRVEPGEVRGGWAAEVAREEARRRGYEIEPHTGRSVVAVRPGRRFAARYLQNDGEAGALLGIGPFAESHAFGIARYRRVLPGGEEHVLAGVDRTLEAERAHHLARRVLRGLPLVRAEHRAAFGRELEDDLGPELAYLRGRGELELKDEAYVPAPEAPGERNAWLFPEAAVSGTNIATALDADLRATDLVRRRWTESPFSPEIRRFLEQSNLAASRTELEWEARPGEAPVARASVSLVPAAFLDGAEGLLDRGFSALGAPEPPPDVLRFFEETAREGLVEAFELEYRAPGDFALSCHFEDHAAALLARFLAHRGAAAAEARAARTLVLSCGRGAGWTLAAASPLPDPAEFALTPLHPRSDAHLPRRVRVSTGGEDLAASALLSASDRAALLELGARARVAANSPEPLVCSALTWPADAAGRIVSAVWTLRSPVPRRRHGRRSQ